MELKASEVPYAARVLLLQSIVRKTKLGAR